jgi:hypothetical protein
MRVVMFFGQDQQEFQMLMDSCIRFVGKVPVKRLAFLKDPQFWELIHDRFESKSGAQR